MPPRFLRLPSVCDRTGRRRSSLYDDIKQGVFVPPVKIGEQAVGWPECEVDALVRARIAGLDRVSIQCLVKELVAARALPQGDAAQRT
jgi:prophage regulatory protein